MDIDRLRRILEYSRYYQEEIKNKVSNFYSFTGITRDTDVLNILQIVRPILRKKGFLVLEIPFADREIGALCYKGNALGYVVINTSLPRANVNFAVCHEIYHVFYSEKEFGSKVEFADGYYSEQKEELAANIFAGMLLMPETGFRHMYTLFKNESQGNEKDTMIRLMSYYQAPYMAVLIRCYELELTEVSRVSEELLNADSENIKIQLRRLWLDDSILEASNKDDYAHLESLVTKTGSEGIRNGYFNERTLKKVIRNMQSLYMEIKGE